MFGHTNWESMVCILFIYYIILSDSFVILNFICWRNPVVCFTNYIKLCIQTKNNYWAFNFFFLNWQMTMLGLYVFNVIYRPNLKYFKCIIKDFLSLHVRVYFRWLDSTPSGSIPMVTANPLLCCRLPHAKVGVRSYDCAVWDMTFLKVWRHCFLIKGTKFKCI